MLILSLKVNKSIFSLILVIFHVIYDVIGIAQYNLLKSKMAAKYFVLCQHFKLFQVDLRLKTLETELKRI